jgi:hypothetical protein
VPLSLFLSHRIHLFSYSFILIPSQLCTTQKPNREDEKERVKNAGGTVVWFHTWRVNGVLAVTRSIGDRLLKHIIIPQPEVRPLLLVRPMHTHHRRTHHTPPHTRRDTHDTHGTDPSDTAEPGR